MVVSGNDASYALAEAVSGSSEKFVERMNAKAKKLGLTNTHFMNPCGLNNTKHFSSARTCLLGPVCLEDSHIRPDRGYHRFLAAPIPPVPRQPRRLSESSTTRMSC